MMPYNEEVVQKIVSIVQIIKWELLQIYFVDQHSPTFCSGWAVLNNE